MFCFKKVSCHVLYKGSRHAAGCQQAQEGRLVGVVPWERRLQQQVALPALPHQLAQIRVQPLATCASENSRMNKDTDIRYTDSTRWPWQCCCASLRRLDFSRWPPAESQR